MRGGSDSFRSPAEVLVCLYGPYKYNPFHRCGLSTSSRDDVQEERKCKRDSRATSNQNDSVKRVYWGRSTIWPVDQCNHRFCVVDGSVVVQFPCEAVHGSDVEDEVCWTCSSVLITVWNVGNREWMGFDGDSGDTRQNEEHMLASLPRDMAVGENEFD